MAFTVPRSGARATKSGNSTGIDFSAGAILAWDAEAYDDNAWHDNATNNSRLTVPSGVSRVSVGAHVNMNNVTANTPVTITLYKNGVGFAINTVMTNSTAPAVAIAVDSDCAPGDYYEVNINVNDASADIKQLGSGFWIRAI